VHLISRSIIYTSDIITISGGLLTLDQLFTLPQTHAVLLTIIKEHGGLVEPFFKALRGFAGDNSARHYHLISPGEIKGLMWEALPIAMEEYDPSLGKASTCWGKVTRRLAARAARERCTKGSVRVPSGTKDRYRGIPLHSTQLVEAYLESLQDGDDV
jgi:hypothetical protein